MATTRPTPTHTPIVWDRTTGHIPAAAKDRVKRTLSWPEVHDAITTWWITPDLEDRIRQEMVTTPHEAMDVAVQNLVLHIWDDLEESYQNLPDDVKARMEANQQAVEAIYNRARNNLPDTLRHSSMRWFLSEDEYKRFQQVEAQVSNNTQAIDEKNTELQNKEQTLTDNKKEQQKFAAMNDNDRIQYAIQEIIANLQTEIPAKLQYFDLNSDYSSLWETEKAEIDAYRSSMLQIQQLQNIAKQDIPADATINLQSLTADLRKSITEKVAEYKKIANNTDFNEQEDKINGLQWEIKRLKDDNSNYNDELDGFEAITESEREQYLKTLQDALLDLYNTDPQVKSALDAYINDQEALYAQTQSDIAKDPSLVTSIKEINNKLGKKNRNIAWKVVDRSIRNWIAAWWGFQTFWGLTNILPKYNPSIIQDINGAPDSFKLRATAIASWAAIWFMAHKYVHKVQNNIQHRRENSLTKKIRIRDVMRNDMNLWYKTLLLPVVMMTLLDITGHLWTFLWNKKKKEQGDRIEKAKTIFIEDAKTTTGRITKVSDQNMKDANTTSTNEILWVGWSKWAWPLTAAKTTAIFGTPSAMWVAGESISPEEEIDWKKKLEAAGWTSGMLSSANKKLQDQLNSLESNKKFTVVINGESRTIYWSNINQSVDDLEGGFWGTVAALRMQDPTGVTIKAIADAFNKSKEEYIQWVQTAVTEYNLAVNKTVTVLNKIWWAKVDLKTINSQELQSNMDRLSNAAKTLTESLKQLNPNFDATDMMGTYNFLFKEAKLSTRELIESISLILWLSFISLWYLWLTTVTASFQKDKRLNKFTDESNDALQGSRQEMESIMADLLPFMTHSGVSERVQKLLESLGQSVANDKDPQEALLEQIGNVETELAHIMVRHMINLPARSETLFSELPRDDRNNMPRDRKKRMKKAEERIRKSEAALMAPVVDNIKDIVSIHKSKIDAEAGTFVNTGSLSRPELYSDWILRIDSDGYTSEILLTTIADLMKRSPTFRGSFLKYYNNVQEPTTETSQQTTQAPIAPTDTQNTDNRWWGTKARSKVTSIFKRGNS